MTPVGEAIVESAVLEWLAALGWTVLHLSRRDRGCLRCVVSACFQEVAVRQGFEPWEEVYCPFNGLANRRLQPLGHLPVRGERSPALPHGPQLLRYRTSPARENGPAAVSRSVDQRVARTERREPAEVAVGGEQFVNALADADRSAGHYPRYHEVSPDRRRTAG